MAAVTGQVVVISHTKNHCGIDSAKPYCLDECEKLIFLSQLFF